MTTITPTFYRFVVRNASRPYYIGAVESEGPLKITICLLSDKPKPEFRTFFRKNIISVNLEK